MKAAGSAAESTGSSKPGGSASLLGSEPADHKSLAIECRQFRLNREQPLRVACVGDEARVLSSIDRTRWQQKVLTEDYNRLKQEVAAEISAGSREEAMKRIEAYQSEQNQLNATVRSPEISRNLEKDVSELKKRVDETFQGAPAAVMEKQKSSAKSLQYEGYSNRRSH